MAGPHSFAGASFAVLREDSEERVSEADISVRHVPGGNVSIVDMGGLKLETLTFPVWFESTAEYNAFRAKLGLDGTLVWFDGPASAKLSRLRTKIPNWDGARDGTAEFLLL